MGVKICWHGCASFSLRMYGQEFLFDPFFSPAGSHDAARAPNENAPTPADYLRAHWPDLCLITGGRYDHCDVETIRRLGMMRPQLRFLGGDEVIGVLRRSCALSDACVWPTEVGDVYHMGTVRVETLAGTLGGADGTEGAGALGGADGAEGAGALGGTDGTEGAGVAAAGPGPGGGPAEAGPAADEGPPRGARPAGPPLAPARGGTLGFRLAADLERVYVSGDTTLPGVPHMEAAIAVLCVGGSGAPRAASWETPSEAAPHPAILGESDVVAALRRLSARVLIPIHWDFAGFAGQLDIQGLQRRLAEEMPAVGVVVPPYNEWIEVEA